MPVVRVTGVLPHRRCVNWDGALMSYHSFLVKGSTLGARGAAAQRGACLAGAQAGRLDRRLARAAAAHIFLPLPFLPLDRRLFLPIAMLQCEVWRRRGEAFHSGSLLINSHF